jgi:hypothetical protein
VNQLKNSHDLSLWISALFAQRMEMPTSRPTNSGPKKHPHPIIVYLARPFFGMSPGRSKKQRQFRREATVARKRYTEGPALLRHPQGAIGYAVSATAHFPAGDADSTS